MLLFGRGTDQKLTNVSASEAVMDGSRSERARARAQHLLAEIAPLPDDTELQRLRELSLNYIREAERFDGKPVTTPEASEQISAALDFFAHALQDKSKRSMRWPSSPDPPASTGSAWNAAVLF
jgi:hypothetical protein